MAATTAPKRHPAHAPSGGAHVHKPYTWLALGGAVFVVAWIVWTVFFASALPR
jgi:hypothetical protein